jgi:membrane-bound ClpP family serine protease
MGMPGTGSSRGLVVLGIICAVLAFFLIPEIFGSIAILIGAQIWRKNPDSSTGLIVLILGLVLMLLAIEIVGPTFYIGYYLPTS